MNGNEDGQLRGPDGMSVGEEELRDLLADEGYSADDRKGRLKEMLTALTAQDEHSPSPERRKLIEEIRNLVRAGRAGQPKADEPT